MSIGLINLFPIPLLDGGHLLFYLIEAVRAQAAERAHSGDRFPHGLACAVVLMLMMFRDME